MKRLTPFIVALCWFALGCDVPAPKQDPAATASPKADAPAPTAQADPHSDPSATPREGEKSLDELKKSYEAAKAEFEKAKDNAGKKKFYVDELVVYATAVMLDPEAPAKEKYPASLKLFREAVALDPNNKDAKENIAMIEDIYKSMKRPVPN